MKGGRNRGRISRARSCSHQHDERASHTRAHSCLSDKRAMRNFWGDVDVEILCHKPAFVQKCALRRGPPGQTATEACTVARICELPVFTC